MQIVFERTSVKIMLTNTVIIAMYEATIGKLCISTFETTSNQVYRVCINVFQIEKSVLILLFDVIS